MKKLLILILFFEVILCGCYFQYPNERQEIKTQTPTNTENTITVYDTIEEQTTLYTPTLEETREMQILIIASTFDVAFFKFEFEENDKVHIDDFMMYFRLFGMYGENYKFKEEYTEYLTGEGYYEILIPVEIVEDFLRERFAVTFEYKDSRYFPAGRTDVFLVEASARGGDHFRIIEQYEEEDHVILNCESGYYIRDKDSGLVHITQRFQLCIELEEPVGFKYIYCRNIEIGDYDTIKLDEF